MKMNKWLMLLLLIPVGCANSSPEDGSNYQQEEQTLPDRPEKPTPETYNTAPMIQESQVEETVSGPCLEAVESIVTSSEAFQKYVKQSKEMGFTLGYRLEQSPNPTEDEAEIEEVSDHYVFAIHESSPDHTSTLTRLAFNPKTHKLYEDVIGDGTYDTEVKYDEELVGAFEEQCR